MAWPVANRALWILAPVVTVGESEPSAAHSLDPGAVPVRPAVAAGLHGGEGADRGGGEGGTASLGEVPGLADRGRRRDCPRGEDKVRPRAAGQVPYGLACER